VETLEIVCSWEGMWLIDLDPISLGGSKVEIDTLDVVVDSGSGTCSKDDGIYTGEPARKYGWWLKSGTAGIKEDVVFHGIADVSEGDKVTKEEFLVTMHVGSPEAKFLRPFAVGQEVPKQ